MQKDASEYCLKIPAPLQKGLYQISQLGLEPQQAGDSIRIWGAWKNASEAWGTGASETDLEVLGARVAHSPRACKGCAMAQVGHRIAQQDTRMSEMTQSQKEFARVSSPSMSSERQAALRTRQRPCLH